MHDVFFLLLLVYSVGSIRQDVKPRDYLSMSGAGVRLYTLYSLCRYRYRSRYRCSGTGPLTTKFYSTFYTDQINAIYIIALVIESITFL